MDLREQAVYHLDILDFMIVVATGRNLGFFFGCSLEGREKHICGPEEQLSHREQFKHFLLLLSIKIDHISVSPEVRRLRKCIQDNGM